MSIGRQGFIDGCNLHVHIVVENERLAQCIFIREILLSYCFTDGDGVGFGQRLICIAGNHGNRKDFEEILIRPDYMIFFDVVDVSLYQIRSAFAEPDCDFYFGIFRDQRIGHYRWSIKHVVVIATKFYLTFNAIDAIGMSEVLVVTDFIDHK